jgi:hypothetical protein
MTLKREIEIPEKSTLTVSHYQDFLQKAFEMMQKNGSYFSPGEDINTLELAHLVPEVPESVIAIYVGINDAVCNKGLVSPFLVRHSHNNVFVFDPEHFEGDCDVPAGTVDARAVLNGFEPPNESWDNSWTYVMLRDPSRTFDTLWKEKGYIDMIPAKFEDFTMISDPEKSRVCTFIDPAAFDHPVNRDRPYLVEARRRGEKEGYRFTIPEGLEGETHGLIPVILNRMEKLYVATIQFGGCDHCWSNIHPDNREMAVINENSAVPLDLVIAKPPLASEYARRLTPVKGSADMTTDWFCRGRQISRSPLLRGFIKG